VLFIDEAGMAPTRVTARLFEHAEKAGAKIVAVGDAGQLASVSAGGWFAALSSDHRGATLRQVMRQRDPEERAALAALHDGDAERYLAHKAKDITLHATDTDAQRAAIERWADLRVAHGGGNVLMIVRDNETRQQLNALARERLRADGVLGADVVVAGQCLAIGDRVITRRNDRRADVDNGSTGTVAAADPHRGVVIRTADGRETALSPSYVAQHLEHAYAVTGHASQGATVDAAVVVGRPEEFTRQWAYTALSRSRGQTHIELITAASTTYDSRADYAPAPEPREPPDALEALARTMRRSEAEPLATEALQGGSKSARSHPGVQSGWPSSINLSYVDRPQPGDGLEI
jgi:ATP-dependent exoDNAse (exonuclease V) alpha subunit